TDAHHVYRLQRAGGGVGATLLIDGVVRLTLASIGPVENSGPLVYFGDPTYWANSESYTSMVRYSGTGNGPITGVTGPRSIAACPGHSAPFSVGVTGTGPFSFQWQIRNTSDVWQILGNDPGPIACPGGGSGFSFAAPLNSSMVTIGVQGCRGVQHW